MSTAATHTFLDAIRHLPVGGALSIPDVPWADYEALLTELGDGYAVRVMYDRGRLEIVSPSDKHEVYARAGVAHAWLIDPLPRTLEVLRLEGGHWVIVSVHAGDEEVRVPPFAETVLALKGLWVD